MGPVTAIVTRRSVRQPRSPWRRSARHMHGSRQVTSRAWKRLLFRRSALAERAMSVGSNSIAGVFTAALLISASASVHAETDVVQVVLTSGSGRFHKCWDLFFYTVCKNHHVRLPERIAVGDAIELEYGAIPNGTSSMSPGSAIITAAAQFAAIRMRRKTTAGRSKWTAVCLSPIHSPAHRSRRA